MRLVLLLAALSACADEPGVKEWSCGGTGMCDGTLVADEPWQMIGTRAEVDETTLWWANMCIEVHGEDGCTVLVCSAICVPE